MNLIGAFMGLRVDKGNFIAEFLAKSMIRLPST